MLKKRTVFVLGAGASSPYGYPLGRELVNQIVRISRARGSHMFGPAFDNFQTQLRRSAMYSVDAFLEYRNEYVTIGSAAIANALLRYELDNLLWPDEEEEGTDNWYAYFLNKLATGISFNAFFMLPVVFITFNYDRSLEHFLLNALMCRYGAAEDTVAPLLKGIPIIHVHGDLGPLPFQTWRGDDRRDYKYDPENVDVARAASGIKIIHGADANSPEFIKARAELECAERIYFLRFGYHPTNMERLGFTKGAEFLPQSHRPTIRGTGYGLTDANRFILSKRHPNLTLGDKNHRITDFLDNCQHFLEDLDE